MRIHILLSHATPSVRDYVTHGQFDRQLFLTGFQSTCGNVTVWQYVLLTACLCFLWFGKRCSEIFVTYLSKSLQLSKHVADTRRLFGGHHFPRTSWLYIYVEGLEQATENTRPQSKWFRKNSVVWDLASCGPMGLTWRVEANRWLMPSLSAYNSSKIPTSGSRALSVLKLEAIYFSEQPV
jgi:hypothetical protein